MIFGLIKFFNPCDVCYMKNFHDFRRQKGNLGLCRCTVYVKYVAQLLPGNDVPAPQDDDKSAAFWYLVYLNAYFAVVRSPYGLN
jgi:hypothetical protein